MRACVFFDVLYAAKMMSAMRQCELSVLLPAVKYFDSALLLDEAQQHLLQLMNDESRYTYTETLHFGE